MDWPRHFFNRPGMASRDLFLQGIRYLPGSARMDLPDIPWNLYPGGLYSITNISHLVAL